MSVLAPPTAIRKLDLACGAQKAEGHFGVDVARAPGVDLGAKRGGGLQGLHRGRFGVWPLSGRAAILPQRGSRH